MARRLVLSLLLVTSSALPGPFQGLHSAETQEGSEAALLEHFARTVVISRIDLPAHKDGVDLRMWETPRIDASEVRSRIEKHGVAIVADQQVSRITAIKKRRKHIEVHFNGGGWSGRVPSVPWQLDQSVEEVGLGRPAPPEDREANRRRRAELSIERQRADDRLFQEYLAAVEEYEQKKRAAGSRINIRYRDRVTDRQLTPEALIAALSGFVDFRVAE